MKTRCANGLGWLVLVLTLSINVAARAQDGIWVQIEAQPTLAEAQARARAYAGAFPDVAGFALRTGWFGIVLGPYPPAEAQARLQDLRRERLIPADSFIAYGRDFRTRFWPTGAAAIAPATVAPTEAEVIAGLAPQPDTAPALPADETTAEARAAEAALTADDRMELQTALQWFGHYDASIDGAFGPGTRAAMAAWQAANAAEPTGILTTAQRARLIAAHRSAMAELGLETVTETEAGIEIDLPLAMIQFDQYDPPFVRYGERNGSGVSALLISQPGEESALRGLYDLLQTLEIVPLNGERTRGERSFEISGRNDRIASYTHAELQGGLIKGFVLVWPVAQDAKMARVLDAMKKSFRPLGDRALDPGLAPLNAAQRDGLLSGLEIRKPGRARSGFFIDATGTVLTTTDVLDNCTRITIDGTQDMDLRLNDRAAGLAVLTPKRALAPPSVAMFQTTPERTGTEVAVAGYPFEGALTSPTLTFGHIEAQEGLEGEPGLKRLSLPAKTGDAGGPVIDGTGVVIGMLLPRDTNPARLLPPDVNFALTAAAISARLGAEGITLTPAGSLGALPPEDLIRRATGMTVLVSCWN